MKLSPRVLWNLKENELTSVIESGLFNQKRKKIRFYAPSFTYYKTRYYCSSPTSFPTISVTGTFCALNCKHCGGKVLETMHLALAPKDLFDLCVKLKQNGAQGCLISGGCLADGSVPLEKFVPEIKKIRRDLGLTVFVHTGVISFETAVALKGAGVDAALIDIIGSEETITKICNLKINTRNFEESLKALDKSGLSFVPHVIVGLNEGKLDGELQALEMISRVKPSAVVIIAFMPIPGTLMAKTPPPRPIDIARVTSVARTMFPDIPLTLGCMRPKGKARAKTDVLSLKAGVDAIAFPSEEAIKYVENMGLKTSFSSYCCAQMYLDATEKSFL